MKGRHHFALGFITFLVYVFLIGPLLIIMQPHLVNRMRWSSPERALP